MGKYHVRCGAHRVSKSLSVVVTNLSETMQCVIWSGKSLVLDASLLVRHSSEQRAMQICRWRNSYGAIPQKRTTAGAEKRRLLHSAHQMRSRHMRSVKMHPLLVINNFNTVSQQDSISAGARLERAPFHLKLTGPSPKLAIPVAACFDGSRSFDECSFSHFVDRLRKTAPFLGRVSSRTSASSRCDKPIVRVKLADV